MSIAVELAVVGFDAAHFDPVVAHHHVGAHADQRIGEPDVALDARPPDAFHPQRAAAERAGREEIRRRRRIAFHHDRARRLVPRASRDGEALPSRRARPHAEALHQLDRDLDVGLRDQLAVHFARSIAPLSCADSGSVIRSAVRNWLDTSPRTRIGCVDRDLRRVNPQRRKAVVLLRSRCCAPICRKPSTRSPIGRSCMRGTPCTRYSPPLTRKRGRQRTHRRARVAEKKLRRLRRETRRRVPVTTQLVAVVLEPTPSVFERGEHHARVVGIEQVGDRGFAFGQRREQQHAVRNALRAGQPNRAGRTRKRSEIEVFHD